MKKINKILIFLIFLLVPINVFACPHVDEEGKLHFQFYNEDYTEMTMMYPNENHLYDKIIDLNTKELLQEDFGFPIIQDQTSYMENYYFIDERLQREDWQTLDIKTTIEGIDNMQVKGTGYELNVGLTNTFNESIKLADEDVFQMYYGIYIDRLNDDEDQTETKQINETIKENNIELYLPEILKLSSTLLMIDNLENNYDQEKIVLESLYDEIKIKIPEKEITDEKLIAINLEANETFSETYEVSYDKKDASYNFTISDTGTYVIIKDEIEKELEKPEVIEETDEEEIDIQEDNEENFITLIIIIASSVVAIILITTITFILIRKKK